MRITRRTTLLGALGAAACSGAPPAASEGRVEVIGGSVAWWRVGDGPGAPLLVVHGGPNVPSDYLEPLGALGAERPVYFWDQLGCGRSDRASGAELWTRQRFVDEMARVRTALGLSRVHILGHSWGTMLTADYLLDNTQDGVASVVLAGPVMSAKRYVADVRAMLAELTPEQQAVVAAAERTGAYDTPDYRAVTEAFYALHLARHPSETTAPLLQASFDGIGVECYTAMNGPSEFSFVGSLRDYEREADLARIHGPTLYLSGEFDTCTPEASRQYSALTPNSRVAVIAGAGHLTTIDEPEATVEAVGAFLREADA